MICERLKFLRVKINCFSCLGVSPVTDVCDNQGATSLGMLLSLGDVKEGLLVLGGVFSQGWAGLCFKFFGLTLDVLA